MVRVFICTDSFNAPRTTGSAPPVSLPPLAVHSCFAFSSGSQSAVEWTGSVCFSSLKVPSVPWRLCHRVFAWNPSLSVSSLDLAATFQDSMLPVEEISRVSAWQATLRPNFISHCFLLQSSPFPVPSLFPNNQVASLHSSFV